MRITGLLLGIALSVMSVIGCSPEGKNPQVTPDLQRLEQRVLARWNAMVAKDFATVWEFATPNYRRNFPKELFVRNFSYAVDWELTGIEDVAYDADAAVASVAVRVMSVPTKQTSVASIAIGAVPIIFREQWLFVDGEWWHSNNL